MNMENLLEITGNGEDNNVNHSHHSSTRVVKTEMSLWNLRHISDRAAWV